MCSENETIEFDNELSEYFSNINEPPASEPYKLTNEIATKYVNVTTTMLDNNEILVEDNDLYNLLEDWGLHNYYVYFYGKSSINTNTYTYYKSPI